MTKVQELRSDAEESRPTMDNQTAHQNGTRTPATLGLAMVKNEQDSIEAFVRHNLRFLNHLVIVDNGSVDGTRAILTQLAAEFPELVLAEDDAFGYNQSERMTRWLHEYQARFAADFILPLDADEFLDMEGEHSFHDILREIPEGGCGQIPWCTYVLTPGADISGRDPFHAMQHRRRTELPVRYKMILRLDGQSASGLELAQGNHAVRSTSGREIEVKRLNGLRLLHYPLRSLDQAKAKCVVGWMAYLALDPRTGETKQGHTWRSSFNKFVSEPSVDYQALCEMSLLYTQDPRVIDWTTDVVEEPSRLVYKRRYSTGHAMEATQLVARSWEQSVTYSGRHSPSLKIAALVKERRPADQAQQPTPVEQKTTETEALARMVQEGRTVEAIQHLEAALPKGETAELWNDWATLQCGSGDVAKAEKGYRRALELDRAHRQTAINLGLLLLARGQLQEGLNVLNPHAATLTVEEKAAVQTLVAPHRAAAQAKRSAALGNRGATPSYAASSSLVGSKRKFLIVVRAGDASLHPTWLEGCAERNWDLLVHSYGSNCSWSDQPGLEVIRAVGSDIQGPKMRAIHSLYTQKRDFFLSYDYICFADDDLAASLETINCMFLLCEHYGLELAQPALTHDSHMGNWGITMENTSFLLRYTNFVEVMCPVFSRAFLDLCAPTFNENLSGYGLDLLWSSWVSSPWKIAILDACPVRHTRASFSGHLYKMLAEMGVSPDQELIDFIKRWHLVREEDQIPGQVVVPTAVNLGGILRDQTRITVQNGQGVELMRALLNGFPRELATEPPKVLALLYPIIKQTLARYEHGDPDPDRPEREKMQQLAHR